MTTPRSEKPLPLTAEEEARLRRVLADESLGRRYVGGFPVRRILATLDAARSEHPDLAALDLAEQRILDSLNGTDKRGYVAAELRRLRSALSVAGRRPTRSAYRYSDDPDDPRKWSETGA